jgi:hypothetical protein
MIDHFEQNRPVHLARRDVYFERSAELISAQQMNSFSEADPDRYEEMLFLLRVARQHARFSVRHAGRNEIDEQFCRFVELLTGNVKAVLSMINLKGMVERSGDSFFNFLGVNKASAALQGEEYLRRANDLIRSIHNTLQLARDPFEMLKKENADGATQEDRLRYEKAREHFMKLVKDEYQGRDHDPSLRLGRWGY